MTSASRSASLIQPLVEPLMSTMNMTARSRSCLRRLVKSSGAKLGAGAHVGIGVDERVEIDAVAVRLALEQALFAAHQLERALQLARCAARTCASVRSTKAGSSGVDVELAHHAPVLAVVPAAAVPFVVEVACGSPVPSSRGIFASTRRVRRRRRAAGSAR